MHSRTMSRQTIIAKCVFWLLIVNKLNCSQDCRAYICVICSRGWCLYAGLYWRLVPGLMFEWMGFYWICVPSRGKVETVLIDSTFSANSIFWGGICRLRIPLFSNLTEMFPSKEKEEHFYGTDWNDGSDILLRKNLISFSIEDHLASFQSCHLGTPNRFIKSE